MWIERIDFAGFGKLSGEKIEFKPNKLNLIVEPNDYGKSTIADAVWAVIYDFPRHETIKPGCMSARDARRPAQAKRPPYIASIDVTAKGRSLKVIRDFDDGVAQIVDRARGNRDVTAEFLAPNGDDEIGQRLTGVSRELFMSTFYVGQRKLDEQKFDSDVASLLQAIADSASPSGNAASGLALIDEVLNQYTYAGHKFALPALILKLQTRQRELKAAIAVFEEQRAAIIGDLEALNQAPSQAPALEEEQVRANEYFELCLQAADLDNRLIRTQNRMGKYNQLKEQADSLASIQSFPIDSAKQVEELWLRRKNKREQLAQVTSQLEPQQQLLKQKEAELNSRYSGMQRLTPEDVQNLNVVTSVLRKSINELADLRSGRPNGQTSNAEDENISQGIKLDPDELGQARNFESLLEAAKTQMSGCEQAINKARSAMVESEDRKSKKSFFEFGGGKKKDTEAAEKEIQAQTTLLQQLKTKIESLEIKLDGLARKAGVKDGETLLKQIQSGGAVRTSQPVSVKSQTADTDEKLKSAEAAHSKALKDLAYYFAKADRGDREVSVESAQQFTAEVSHYAEEARNVQGLLMSVQQMQKQREFAAAEVRDTEQALQANFARVGVPDPANLDEGYREFNNRLNMYSQWEVMREELGRLEEAIARDIPETDRDLGLLEKRRNDTWTRMQELIQEYPDIAELEPPVGLTADSGASSGESQAQREQRTARVRKFYAEYDRNFLFYVAELEKVEHDLEQLQQAKRAVDLARETLHRLSSATYVDWATKLNAIAQQMIETMGMDLENLQFDSELKLSVSRRGQPEKLKSQQIMSQLSTGAKEQLHWIARMVICRFLTGQDGLPIILDEVFSEVDDHRFARAMNFLLDFVAQSNNQIIMFSCHQQRYRWLLDNLSEERKALIEVCQKTSLRPDPLRA